MKLDLVRFKRALPHIKTALVVVANGLADKEYKHKEKVEKVLNGAYKTAEVLERVL